MEGNSECYDVGAHLAGHFYPVDPTSAHGCGGGECMRGNEEVINELNRALNTELTAIVQYMVQAEMCDN